MNRREFLRNTLAGIVLANSPSIKAEEKTHTETLEKVLDIFLPNVTNRNELISSYEPGTNYSNLWAKDSLGINNLEMINYLFEHTSGSLDMSIAEGVHYMLFRENGSINYNIKGFTDEGRIYLADFLIDKNKCKEISEGESNKEYWKSFKELDDKARRHAVTTEQYLLDEARIKVRTDQMQSDILSSCLKKLEDEKINNQVSFVGCVLTHPFANKMRQKNSEWVNKPWLEPKKHFNPGRHKEPNPLDPKTGEFVYYGEDYCLPCHEVSRFLLVNKIKFRELSTYRSNRSFDGVPALVYNGKVIMGSGVIIDRIKEMYGIL